MILGGPHAGVCDHLLGGRKDPDSWLSPGRNPQPSLGGEVCIRDLGCWGLGEAGERQ